MLETRELCKTYKPKKGVPVMAIDHVSLRFPEKGMVFLLGKSGSGKSTMLNLLGGLDQYDGGEIIIKGMSSMMISASSGLTATAIPMSALFFRNTTFWRNSQSAQISRSHWNCRDAGQRMKS